MACLGAVLYDPAAAVTKATTALLAMTAMDTTNLRVTFTAPANGMVLVKIRVPHKGSTTNPMILLGVLDGATVRGRQASIAPGRGTGSANLISQEAVFPVTGLTGGNSYSFDLAYGVEQVVASTQLGYGGANDTTASNAYGAASMEVWEMNDCLGAKHYDPASAGSVSTATASVMAAMNTTNLRLAVTIPASGRIFVRLRGVVNGSTNAPAIHLGVMDGSTIRMRQAAWIGTSQQGTLVAGDLYPCEASAVISGLTPGSMTLDAAWATETVQASTAIKYGGPNDTTINNAFGGFTFEVWKA